jgi:hypothetical protein
LKLFFTSGFLKTPDQAISSFRLAPNDSTFALNSLLRTDFLFLAQVVTGKRGQVTGDRGQGTGDRGQGTGNRKDRIDTY